MGWIRHTGCAGTLRKRLAEEDRLAGARDQRAEASRQAASSQLLSHRRTIADCERRIVDPLTRKEKGAVGEIKEARGLTRRSLIPLLEYFDEQGVTVRAGNERRLRHRTAL